jgi:hypothetical protein
MYKIYKAKITKTGELQFEGNGITRTAAGIPVYIEASDWKFITAQLDIKSISGAEIALSAYTSVNSRLKPDTIPATISDGETAFEIPEQDEAGSTLVTIAREDGLGHTSNIAGLLGFQAIGDVTGIDAELTILIV